MKRFLLLLTLLPFVFACQKQDAAFSYFPLDRVELLDSPFKHAQDLNRGYLLEMEADRLLAPYLREAGLEPKAESYTNWENTGLDGHIGGHYVSALSLMFASTGDEQIGERLDYMLSELQRVQQANGNGYIGGVPGSQEVWTEIAAGDIRAGGFDLNGKWVPLYNIHKMYAGLRDAWLHTGDARARDMLVAMTDWMIGVTANLSDEQMQDMLRSEHGGLNETFADVAAITGDKKYLRLAERFSHRLILEPLLAGEDKLTGLHANTQIPKVLGYKRIADLGGNPAWGGAARFFWESVTQNRSVNIGGNSVREHFNPVDDFSRMATSEQGPETCNTYNMLRLTMMLNASEPNGGYSDYYEQALYNHILSTHNPHTGGLVYFTPMRPAHYRVYSQPHTSMWCCVGSGIENHSKYGEMIYARQGDQLYVNLFIPSKLDWQEQGVEIIQQNHFPEEPRTTLTIHTERPVKFDLRIRYPEWSEGVTVTMNGEQQSVVREADGYISIDRRWKEGDRVIVELPMSLRVEEFPDRSDFRAFTYGPVVLAARWNTDEMTGMFADDSRGGHIAHGPQVPFAEIPTVSADEMTLRGSIRPSGEPLHFILPVSSGEMELEPFYGLHESRYILYWPTGAVELSSEALEAATVDVVYCGQQQPESDHFVAYDNSETGYRFDRHWRAATGWFSYKMKNPEKAARFLVVTYLNTSEAGHASISIGDRIVKSISTGGGNGEEVTTVIPLPKDLGDEWTVTVKATQNRLPTPAFTEFRLVSEV